MEVTPTLIQKKDNGKYLSIHFDDNLSLTFYQNY